MPSPVTGPIDRKFFKEKLRTDVEKIPEQSIDLVALRAAAQEVLGEYGDAELFQADPLMEAELQSLLDYTNREGLNAEELKAALTEVRRHVSIQAHFDANRAHEDKRSQAGFNPFKHIALNIKDMTTVLGGGIAMDVKEREKNLFANAAEIKAMLQSASELGVMRHRLKRYQDLGGQDFKTAIGSFIHGTVRVNELFDPHHEQGKHYEKGLDAIIAELHLKVGESFKLDGLGEVFIDTPETQAAIEHHLKFILRTEIIKLAEADHLTVLSSEEYNITQPQSGAQKALHVARSVALSGTFWGITTRLGTRAAVGGLIGIGAVSGGAVLVAGLAGGVLAGAAGAYVRETFNSADRLKRRRLEAAIGDVGYDGVKPASKINTELKKSVELLSAAPDAPAIITALEKCFAVASDAQARLRFARTAEGERQQDFISFGVENRFRAQTELLENIERTLAAMQHAMDRLDSDAQEFVHKQLLEINRNATKAVKESRQSINKKITQDEEYRRRRAMIIGGLAGGLGSVLSHYALELWGSNKVAEDAGNATASAEPVIPAAENAVEGTVVLPNSESITTLGKIAAFQPDADHHYQLAFGADHVIKVNQFAPDGSSLGEAASADLPAIHGDALQVVQADQTATIYDANGAAIAEVQFNPAGTTGNITEQFFADPKTAQMLDSMGLQPGELQYDPTNKLFHIPDSALRDAVGKAEYLGQTESWRARRLEFILKAMAEGKATESPEMIVARAERAVSNLLLTKGGLHDDPQAAFDEAFGKDPSFIQRNVMPWVDGTRSRISTRWMNLVAKMKEHPVTGSGAGQEITITQFTPSAEAVAEIPDAGTVATEAAIAEGWKASWEGLGVDMTSSSIVPLLASVLGAGTAEAAMYGMAGKEDNSLDAKRQEFHGDDEHTVSEVELKDIGQTAQEIKTKKLEADKPERQEKALEEIVKVLADAQAAVKAEVAVLQPIMDTISGGGSIDSTMINELVAHVAGVALISSEVMKAQAVLAKEEPDFKYIDLDKANNGSALAKWITAHEGFANIETSLKDGIDQIIKGIATDITETRKKDDSEVPPANRKQQLETVLLPKLALVDQIKSLTPTLITDATWIAKLEQQRAAARTEIEQAVLMIDFQELFGANSKVKPEVMDHLSAAGVLDTTDLSLPAKGKAGVIAKLMSEVNAKGFTKDKPGLLAMKFMKSSMTSPVGADQKLRIKTVLDRLIAGDSDIFRD